MAGRELLFDEVAKTTDTAAIKATAVITAIREALFVFITAVILSSMAFLLKPLHNGLLISARAYEERVSSPKSLTTASSQASSISRLARIYMTHTIGLNQCRQSASIKISLAAESNLLMWIYSWAKT